MSQAELRHIYIYVIIAILVTVLILLSFVIWRQPQNQEITTFKVNFLKIKLQFFEFFQSIVSIQLDSVDAIFAIVELILKHLFDDHAFYGDLVRKKRFEVP